MDIAEVKLERRINTGQYEFDHWTLIARPHEGESPEAIAVNLRQWADKIKGVKVVPSGPNVGNIFEKYPGELTMKTQAGDLIVSLTRGAKHWNDIIQNLKAAGFRYDATGHVWTKKVDEGG